LVDHQPHLPRRVRISVNQNQVVSGLLDIPGSPKACLVLAHGAGAGMTHPFMAATAAELGDRGIATLRFQFPYMEQGSRRPDSPKLAHATVRAAVAEANRHCPDLPLFAGGKSFGGRMTSQAQAASPLPGIRGLAFLGFPLHPAGKPSEDRAQHLFDVGVPMLFLQGTRDALAQPELITRIVERLGDRAALRMFADADHSFHVPARSGRTDKQVRGEALDALADWITHS
jgi:predicted alpha/beta-hydrolase family hydrolase